jgi:Mrp family chromosome partitioning ATPase/capsular polysaccharide biosynthesis protein
VTALSHQSPASAIDPAVDAGPPVLPALWAAKWSIVLTAMCTALLGFGLSALQPLTYQATAELLLADPRNSGVFEDTGVSFLDPSRYVRNQAELARSQPVMAEASELIGGRLSPDEVARRVTVRPSVDLDLLTVTAADGTAPGAAQLANAVAEAYQNVVREQTGARADRTLEELRGQSVRLETTIANAEQELAEQPGNTAVQAERDAAVEQLVSIQNRIDQISVDASLFGAGVDLVEEAETPQSPSAPQPYRNALLAAILGALAAGGLAWWRADETATAEGRNDAGAVLRAPLLGTVPSFEELRVDSALPTLSAPKSPTAEAYQFLVGAIAHALEEVGGRSVLLTSSGPTDGKTLTTINLAIAAKGDGRDVLVVDADTRVRGLTRLLEITDAKGLPQLAEGQGLGEVVTFLDMGEGEVLPIVPAVRLGDDTAAFFRTPDFRRIALEMAEVADLVIYDTPPMMLASDTSAIAASVDGIIVVVARGTPLSTLRQLRERLDLVGTPLIGYIFTKAKQGEGYGYGGSYAYRYGYQYGYGEHPDHGDEVGPDDVQPAGSGGRGRLGRRANA